MVNLVNVFEAYDCEGNYDSTWGPTEAQWPALWTPLLPGRVLLGFRL
jgi:hypothetical protein